MTNADATERRLARIEANLAIQQLAIRYAIAVDSRDIDAVAALFIADVDCGRRRGKGRDAIAGYYREVLSEGFYRSQHQICGHKIDVLDDDHATGVVYCRAEHEDGQGWYVMAIAYFDEYARENGEWLFVRRREKHWYASDLLERPQQRGAFSNWKRAEGHSPALPQAWPSWDRFWRDVAPEKIAELTQAPTTSIAPERR